MDLNVFSLMERDGLYGLGRGVYLPLVKGTSDENERASVLERVMEFVL